MADLHVAKECDRNHGYVGNDKEEVKPVSKATDAEIDDIVSRLYKTHTISSSGGGDVEPMTARDTISKGKAEEEDVTRIIDRLYKTHTKAMQDHPDEQLEAKDTISKAPVSDADLAMIIDRMYQTHTTSSSGGGDQPVICDNSVAKNVESAEEIAEIFQRLQTTHTKSSAGGQECRSWDRIDPPGLGQKMLPPIEGIATRFAGRDTPSDDHIKELTGRLVTTQTTASQARLDNPRILLYPERTTLCNNVERIRSFQESGAVVKQNVMERREKWFN